MTAQRSLVLLPLLEHLDRPPPRTKSAAPEGGAGGSTDTKTNAPERPKALPMAAHVAPIDGDSLTNWSKSNAEPNVVWSAGGLVANMVAVLERRLVYATVRSLHDKPLTGATHARLADIEAFVSGDFDDMRCAALLGGLIWVQPGHQQSGREGEPSISVPFAYAVLKPVFTPDENLHRIGVLAETARLPIPPGLVSRLRAGGPSRDGRVTDSSVRIALARARGSGIASPFDPARAGARQGAGEATRFGAGLRADRLAAAMLIPIADDALCRLVNHAYPGAKLQRNAEQSTEDITDAT